MPSPDPESATSDQSLVLDDELRAKVEELIAHSDMVDIRPRHLEADLRDGVAPGSLVDTVTIEIAMAFAADIGSYGNKFDYSFTLHGGVEKEIVGTVKFTILVDYRVEDDFTPDLDAASYYGSTTGYFAAYPYARELFQSLASRLQFDPLVLGVIKRNTLKPGSINVLPCRSTPALLSGSAPSGAEMAAGQASQG